MRFQTLSSFSHEMQEQAVRVVHPGFFDEEENMQAVITNENSETKMRLRKVASVYGVTPALISKIWQLMRLTPS